MPATAVKEVDSSTAAALLFFSFDPVGFAESKRGLTFSDSPELRHVLRLYSENRLYVPARENQRLINVILGCINGKTPKDIQLVREAAQRRVA